MTPPKKDEIKSCNSKAKLFLTSSGYLSPRIKSEWNKLYEKATLETGSRNIVYIPTALMTNDHESMSQARQVAHDLGVEEVHVLEAKNIPDGQGTNELDDACCVYIEMGNTYFVTYHVRRTGLDKAIASLVGRGGIYGGASAGAILAGRTLRTCEWKNWDDPGHGKHWDLRKTVHGLDGLNLLIDGESIFPHYSMQWKNRVEEMKTKHIEEVIILDESSAYIQDNDGGRLISD